jgi:hypothetical protein
MPKSKSELQKLAQQFGWKIRSLTLSEIDGAMTSDELSFHEAFNAANLAKAFEASASAPPSNTAPKRTAADDQKELDAEFKAWCEAKGISIPNHGEVGIFLNERKQARLDFARFIIDYPQYVVIESNQKKVRAFLDLNDFPVTYENLVAAYHTLKSNLILEKIKPPVDPDKPETRPGQWTNGRFIPFDTGNVEKTYLCGQADASKIAGGEPDIRKNPRNMSAEEFQRACQQSPTFRKKMDKG